MQPKSLSFPVARAVAVVMASCCVLLCAVFAYTHVAMANALADRYVDAELQAKLKRALPWLSANIVNGVAPPSNPERCKGKRPVADSATPYECAKKAISARLSQQVPAQKLSSAEPGDELRPDVLVAMHWLLNNSPTPEKLAELLRHPDQSAEKISLQDPFRLPGCLYLGHEATKHPEASAICPLAASLRESDLPQHTNSLLSPIYQYRNAARGHSPNHYRHQPEPSLVTPLQQGRAVWLGLSDSVQSKAQITADCYTGDTSACGQCPWCNVGKAASMYEGARSRAMGILVVNARNGAIEAAGSAYTDCYARNQQGEVAAAVGCPVLPGSPTPRTYRLGNQALEQIERPGSEIKALIAPALLKSGLSTKEAAAIPNIMTHSLTPELIDIVLCKDSGFQPACALRRLAAIEAMAAASGWGGTTDVLSAGQIPELKSLLFAARLLRTPGGKNFTDLPLGLTAESMKACSATRWRACQGAGLVSVVAELFGEGDSRASLTGIANMMLQLAAADNGQARAPQAHFVTAVQIDTGEMIDILPVQAPATEKAIVRPVVQGMSRTHIAGSAYRACLDAAAAGGVLSCKEGGRSSLRLASKTGTPGFNADKLTLSQWRTQCEKIGEALETTPKTSPRFHYLKNEWGKCGSHPTKWFALAVGAPGGTGWDRIILMQVERNWSQLTDMVDTPNDVGSNVAAEAGLALANALYTPASLRPVADPSSLLARR